MNQHKDLLYRQKYATYQLNNRTFSTQNTKISARSLAISYIYFQVRIVKKKKRGGGESHTINYYGKSGDSRTPDPRQGLYTRNCNGRNYTSYYSWRPSCRPLFAENSRASGGSAPWAPGRGFSPAPRQGPYGGPLDPTRMRRSRARGALRARIFPPTPFLQILDPPHIPPCSSKSLAPRGVDPGGAGEQSPPPWTYWGGGGQTYRFAPPPQ